MRCGANKAGDGPYTDNIAAVLSPYSIQGNSFWVNVSKNNVTQKIYKGLLTENALIIMGEGRKSNRPNSKWKLKFEPKGNKTMGEHLSDGLSGYEGKDRWRRECTMKLDKQVNAVRAHIWAKTEATQY